MVYWTIFSLLIILSKSQNQSIPTLPDIIQTPFYGIGNNQTHGILFDQGIISQITWGILDFRISWYYHMVSQLQFKSSNLSTWTPAFPHPMGIYIDYSCATVTLNIDEWINGYQVQYDTKGGGIYGIRFQTNLNNVYECWSNTIEPNVSFTHTGMIVYDKYYLSGFEYFSGWVLDSISFQFTRVNTTHSEESSISPPYDINELYNDENVHDTNEDYDNFGQYDNIDEYNNYDEYTPSTTNTIKGSISQFGYFYEKMPFYVYIVAGFFALYLLLRFCISTCKKKSEQMNDIPNLNHVRLELTAEETPEGDMREKNEYESVKQWFFESVAVPHDCKQIYYDKFIENGFDNFVGIKHMNNADLMDIGVDKLGHRKTILVSTQKL
eukprot:171871_1